MKKKKKKILKGSCVAGKCHHHHLREAFDEDNHTVLVAFPPASQMSYCTDTSNTYVYTQSHGIFITPTFPPQATEAIYLYIYLFSFSFI